MNPEAWWHYRRARYFLFFNKRDKAIAALKDVLALEPSNLLAANSLGFQYGEKGDYEQAAAQFESVLRANPADANTKFNLGYIRQKQARHEDAIALFESAVKTSPALDRAWFGLGMSQAAL